MMLTGAQCRAARGWVGWSQKELARHANVGVSTVRSLEDGSHTPIPNNVVAIRHALAEAGAAVVLDATDGKAAPADHGKRGNTPQITRSRGSARGKPRRDGDGGKRGR